MNSWQIRNYQKKINLSKVPEFIIDYASDKALEWNTITDMPQNPIVVTVIETDSARVRSVKQSIDISDQIKRCGLSDTVEIPI